MIEREYTTPGLQFRLLTLMIAVVIAAFVATVYARLAPLMARTDNPWFLASLPILNLSLLIAGTALSCCKSGELRALGLACWLLLMLLLALTIGLITLGPTPIGGR